MPAEDQAAIAHAQVTDLSAELTDFSETAQVMANLDLMISMDTSVAHPAGALGRKVWLPVARPTDWRWFRGRDDSP